jgi:hypothetical protein
MRGRGAEFGANHPDEKLPPIPDQICHSFQNNSAIIKTAIMDSYITS